MNGNIVNVTATKWKLGWELTLDTGGVTQSRTLANAEQEVRDYLDTAEPETDHSSWTVFVIPQIGPVLEDAMMAKAASEAAQEATRAAAKRMREAVRGLRDAGLSVGDTAVVLGVSRGRVSQLVA